MLESITVGRIRMNMPVSDGESHVEVAPVLPRTQSRVITKESRPLSEDVDDSTSNDAPSRLFNLGYLKELWNKEDCKDVGCWEIIIFD